MPINELRVKYELYSLPLVLMNISLQENLLRGIFSDLRWGRTFRRKERAFREHRYSFVSDEEGERRVGAEEETT